MRFQFTVSRLLTATSLAAVAAATVPAILLAGGFNLGSVLSALLMGFALFGGAVGALRADGDGMFQGVVAGMGMFFVSAVTAALVAIAAFLLGWIPP